MSLSVAESWRAAEVVETDTATVAAGVEVSQRAWQEKPRAV
jgi:hypothetical protein